MKNTLIVAVIVIWVCICNAFSKVEISADFDNGHMRPGTKIIEAGENVTITSDLFNTNRDLWFNFKLTGVKDKTIVFKEPYKNNRKGFSSDPYYVVTYKPVVNVFENAYENLKNFAYDETTNTCICSHTFREDIAYFSLFYNDSNTVVDNYIRAIQDNPYVTVETLGKSTIFDLPCPLVTVTDKNTPDKDKKVVLLYSRENAWETAGTLTLMGAMKFIASKDPFAEELRKKFIYLFYPIADRDGVHMGHTNWPLTKDGGQYFNGTDWLGADEQSNYDGILKENKMFKLFLENWKKKGMSINISHDFHNGFFNEPDTAAQVYLFYNSEEKRGGINRYVSFLRKKYLINYNVTTAYTKTHLDRVSSPRYLQDLFSALAMITEIKTMTVAGRTTPEFHEQEGELLVRGIADYYGISSQEKTHPFVLVSNVDKYRCKKGEKVKFQALYQDILGRDAEYVKVVAGDKTIKMEKGKGYPTKGVQYECEMIVDSPTNDYYIEVSNGVSSRRIPEAYLQYGPYIPSN